MPTSNQLIAFDGSVTDQYPSRNYGSYVDMAIESAGPSRQAYLYATIPFAPGARIVSAKLHFFERYTHGGGSRQLTAWLLDSKFSESKLNYTNRPRNLSGAPTGATTMGDATAPNREWVIDVTALLQAVADGAPWYGFWLTSNNPGKFFIWSSEASTAFRPRLEIQWAGAPEQPTNLSPGGGRAVSVPRPVHRFNFVDTADDAMSAYQIQWSTTTNPVTGQSGVATMTSKIASLNCNGGYNGNWPARIPMLAVDILAVAPEIVILQEAHEAAGEQTAMLNALHAAGGTWWQLVEADRNDHYLYDSRFQAPVGAVQLKTLNPSGGWSSQKFRDLETGIEWNTWDTHMRAGDATAREQQATSAVPWITALGARIGGGDINEWDVYPRSPLQQFADAGDIDVRNLVSTVTNGTLRSFDGYTANANDGRWIDHLFVGGGIVPTAVGLHDTDSASDHNLIWATFQYSASGTQSGSFDAPTFDTGIVESILPQWEPTLDVQQGQLVSWRVRVRDLSGSWSPWALPVSFTRAPKGTVTITNPANIGAPFVSEPTPPIIWTHTGGQSAFQVFIVDPANSSLVLHDSGKRDGGETAYTIPAGVLTETGANYRVIVRLWDAIARVSTPGDPAYVEASRTFTLLLDNTVAPVTSLSSSAVGDSHGVVLWWSRATAADGFMLRVDGEFVGDILTPESVLVSGTNYSLNWYGATPRRAHALEIVAIVNGRASAGNPVTGVKTEPLGIWLSRADGSDGICLWSGDDYGDWSPTTVSAVHQPVGSPYPVVRTQQIGVRAAKISGYLNESDVVAGTPDMREQVARAHRLRYPAGQLLRLALSDTNVAGVVDQMMIDPADDMGNVTVKFDFYEQGT